MQQETPILSQEYILSDLELSLSNDIEESKIEDNLIVLKHIPSKSYMYVTLEQLWFLRQFREPQTLHRLIPDLIANRKCPPLREVYELVLQALKNGFLISQKVEPGLPHAIAREWDFKLHFKMAKLFSVICVAFGLGCLSMTTLTLPNIQELLMGYLAICGAISLGYFLSACILRGFDHEVYDIGINYKHLFPHFYVDISDARMGGRNCETNVALIQLAPIFLFSGIMAYWFPGVVFILLLGIFQITQPYRNSSGWLFIASLFHKKTLAVHNSPLFHEELSLVEKLKRNWALKDKRFLVVSTAYTLIWASTFVIVLLNLFHLDIQVFLKSYVQEGYYMNFLIFMGSVLTFSALYILIELMKTKGTTKKKPTKPKVPILNIKSPKDPGLSHSAVVNFLKHCLLLQDLKDEDLDEIADHLDIRFFKKKQFVYQEEEIGSELHIIIRGKVEMMMNLKSGRPVRVAELSAGEIFGEKAVIFDIPHSRSIRTVTQTECFVLPSEAFKTLVLNKLGFKRVRTIIEKHYFMFRIPLCQEWSPDTMGRFAQVATFARYQAKEKILATGLSNKFFYIVYDGILEVRRNGESLAKLESGEFFGEISLLQNSVCSADVVAVTDCRCLIVSRNDFLNMIGKDYKFGLQFERISSRRLNRPVFPLKGVNYSEASIR